MEFYDEQTDVDAESIEKIYVPDGVPVRLPEGAKVVALPFSEHPLLKFWWVPEPVRRAIEENPA